jgi:TolB-like protein
MKKILQFSILFLACSGLFAQNVSLDQAVQTSAKAVETGLPKGAKAAVLTFTSTKQDFSDYIIDELATALSASKNIQVIDRQHTDAIRKEFNIQFSGDVSDDEVKRVGRQLGAQYVVTGSLVDIGNAYRFRLAAINIESAVREGSSSLNININDPQVTFLLTGQRTTQPTNTPNNSGTYRIGDRGPAGGFVFYDKGVFSGGWRYLEVAPVETEFSNVQWGANVAGTSTVVGSGKRNTQIIVEYLNQRGESGRAAQLCASLNFDSYTDWFMPSRDELVIMHNNLKQRGLGDFGDNAYWSSSQEDNGTVWTQGFINDGWLQNRPKSIQHKVRAVRAF